jgi:hypothetical protein
MPSVLEVLLEKNLKHIGPSAPLSAVSRTKFEIDLEHFKIKHLY